MKSTQTGFYILALVGAATACSAPTPSPDPAPQDTSSQLYIEVSALGSRDYSYNHKLGMKLGGC